jgi:hypothetical protein
MDQSSNENQASETFASELKMRQEAAACREAILEGLEDVVQGRTLAYQGSVRRTLQVAKEMGLLQ